MLADPPWRFQNRTGKVAPEHRRLSRYDTMAWKEIAALPVADAMAPASHCYLWVPNALLAEGLRVLEGWGFTYKTMLVWHKVRKDGGSDGRGVGFYFRNVTEPVLFGVRGRLRTGEPARRQVNLLATQKREHSRKPDELYPVIEACSPGPVPRALRPLPAAGLVELGGRGRSPRSSRAAAASRPTARRARVPSGRGSGPGARAGASPRSSRRPDRAPNRTGTAS